MICAAVYRTLSWKTVREACAVTLRLSCMVLWIIFAASIFTALYSAIGAQDLVRSLLSYMPGGAWGAVIGMQIIWVIMGALLDPIGIMMITAPLFFPIVTALGFDPVWFRILFVVNMEMAFLSPPFGFNLFYMTVKAWHVKVGDRVAAGAELVEVETEKATVIIEADAAGIVRELRARVGDRVPIGAVVAVIEAGG